MLLVPIAEAATTVSAVVLTFATSATAVPLAIEALHAGVNEYAGEKVTLTVVVLEVVVMRPPALLATDVPPVVVSVEVA
jgi:hypothetical protein